ncbi:M1 family metallopeptidase [Candidatus Saccharibacteria bacterium]|nr:M1 family metallopeptidase [Candidatus Saccharibacteria bacterium]
MFTRLYNSFKPKHYDLSLDINRTELTFTGSVTVAGSLLQPQQYVELHAKELVVTSAYVDGMKASTTFHEFDVLRIESSTDLTAGEHEIVLEFSGRVHDDSMVGMYVSKFTHDGAEKQIILTQFESHHAREVFPCIDEPEAKATFQLTLQTPVGEPVLSNTPVESENVNTDLLVTTFETTPIMSTYLLAFAFGDMHYVEDTTEDGTVLRTWSSVAQPKSWLNYSLQEGKRILEFFSKYFDTPFPLKKCDQLALPDFDAGAMENWGMITYREIALLSDPDNRSVSTEQYVSLVVAHELSHQWFGNLVTMKWWDDLWLNESFASIMEHLALNALHPDWHQWEEYTSTDVVSTSGRDIYSDVQPVRVDVTDPALIETLFDPAIVYAKGGRLIKMLREYISDDAFRTGLKGYFDDHAYKNTTRDDLWVSLSKSSGKDVTSLMNPWLAQSGMPIVSVNQSGSEVALTQERFVLDSNDDTSLWPIPLLSPNTLSEDIFSTKQISLTAPDSEFIVLNQYGSGHYLVKYTNPEHIRALSEKLHGNLIPAEGKIALFNDQLLLNKRGDSSITETLTLAKGNSSETRDAVWSLMASSFGTARALVEGDDDLDLKLKQTLASMIKLQYDRLGWDTVKSEDPNDSHLRVSAVALTIAGEDSEATAHALNLYEQHIDDLEQLPADLRSVILRCAVRNHDDHDAVLSCLMSLYQSTASADLQLDITSALTQTKHSNDVAQYISEAISKGGFVRAQDFIRWIALLAGNHHTRDALWTFFEDNWPYVKQMLHNSKSYDYFPVYAARGLSTEGELQRYKDFFVPKLNEVILERNIKVALSDIQAKIAWRKRDEAKIVQWLKKL